MSAKRLRKTAPAATVSVDSSCGGANTPRFVLLRASRQWKARAVQGNLSGVLGLPQSAAVAPRTGRADIRGGGPGFLVSRGPVMRHRGPGWCSRTSPGPWHGSREGSDGQRGMRKGRYVRRRADDWCNTTPPERYNSRHKIASFLGAFLGFRRNGLGNTFTPHPPGASELRFLWTLPCFAAERVCRKLAGAPPACF